MIQGIQIIFFEKFPTFSFTIIFMAHKNAQRSSFFETLLIRRGKHFTEL